MAVLVKLHELLSAWLEMGVWEGIRKMPLTLAMSYWKKPAFLFGGRKEKTFSCLFFGAQLQQMHLAYRRLPYLRKPWSICL